MYRLLFLAPSINILAKTFPLVLTEACLSLLLKRNIFELGNRKIRVFQNCARSVCVATNGFAARWESTPSFLSLAVFRRWLRVREMLNSVPAEAPQLFSLERIDRAVLRFLILAKEFTKYMFCLGSRRKYVIVISGSWQNSWSEMAIPAGTLATGNGDGWEVVL